MPPPLTKLPRQFGNMVRQLRTAADLSQIALAERAGLTHNYVGEIERGEKLASLETIVRLASGLELKSSELLEKAGL